jgi:hypothetical protein
MTYYLWVKRDEGCTVQTGAEHGNKVNIFKMTTKRTTKQHGGSFGTPSVK